MPTYEYECEECGGEWEEEQHIKDEPAKMCPLCGEEAAKRLISSGTAFSLNGAGWAKDGSGVVLNHRYDLYFQPFELAFQIGVSVGSVRGHRAIKIEIAVINGMMVRQVFKTCFDSLCPQRTEQCFLVAE